MFRDMRIYLDHAGATPINKEVLKEIHFYEKKFFANPSAIYKSGVYTRNLIEESRNKIAKLINAHPNEIIFTGSGTESDALAVIGVIKNFRENNKNVIPHIVTTTIEHPAIIENCKMLEREGIAEITYVKVNEKGIVNPKDIKESIKENTILVSVMYANNEIGTIQPIQEIAKEIRYIRKIRQAEQNNFSLFFHTDACQAMNYLYTENIEKLGVDLMTFNSSKIYGPKGVGILYKKREVNISNVYGGGGQEFGLRSGTENTPYIIGAAKALEITCNIKDKESLRLSKIRDYTIAKLINLAKETGYEIKLNGDSVNRLPNNINISIIGISSELLVVELDVKGIMVSEKSACHSSDSNKSYVISAIRKTCRKDKKEEGSIRISLGRGNNKKDMDILISSLRQILNKYKKFN